MKKKGSGVIGRALADRVERLETQRGLGGRGAFLPFPYKVRFVSRDRGVVSILTLHEDGRREWWHAPGEGPEPQAEAYATILPPQDGLKSGEGLK